MSFRKPCHMPLRKLIPPFYAFYPHRLFTLETCFQLFSSILSITICNRGAQLLVNCFEKIAMATNNSRFDSTYLLVSEERRERRERQGASEEEEDSSGKFMLHLRLAY